MMRIDHVILGARTIEPLREPLWEQYGFGITDGSPNPDGTASWVVPFDTPNVQYLELLVIDNEQVLALRACRSLTRSFLFGGSLVCYAHWVGATRRAGSEVRDGPAAPR
ncbi:VOC family protein [Streptomyces sp. NBC_01619]|uniref:VOC family protein n=1 Tax=Streptomyces sp. NBC_01619 TaxID=2975901 RepID=UPI00225800D2|nr:VOC family protein [Streptomyces sp. NBC_01619]MCX4515759.1 VOC family protein [Streptomyces sp. NBC_01619]